jgi:hypothetical protein
MFTVKKTACYGILYRALEFCVCDLHRCYYTVQDGLDQPFRVMNLFTEFHISFILYMHSFIHSFI